MGVHKVLVDGARILDGVLDRPARDFIEGRPAALLPRSNQLGDVPGNGLAFAVGVGRQEYPLGLFGGLAELLDNFLAPGENLVFGQKSTFDFDAQALFREVANMAFARFDLKIFPEILLNGFGFGRRFNDDE